MKPHVVTHPITPRSAEIPPRITYEESIITEAGKTGYFTATIKVGRGKYHTEKLIDLPDAKRMAEALATLYKEGYHCMVYAVAKNHQVYVGSWVPGEGWRDRRP